MENPEKLLTYGAQDKRQRQTKHHHTQANTCNVNMTWALLQTTGDKDEPNIVLMGKS